MNKLDYSRMKDAAAIQFMVLDMLGNIMTLSETPAKMGIYLDVLPASIPRMVRVLG